MSNNEQPRHSLPARPPTSTVSAPPSRNNNFGGGRGQAQASSYAGFTPRAVAAQGAAQYSAPPSNYQNTPVSNSFHYSHANQYYQYNVNPSLPSTTSSAYTHPTYTSASAYDPSQYTSSAPYSASAYPTASAYSNPYAYQGYSADPSAAGYQGGASNYNAEEEARIAEWSSAYTADPNAKKSGNAQGVTSTPEAAAPTIVNGKKQTVVREGGGKKWEDDSLLEWDPMHPRLFIGNLAGEVTDDSLYKAFSKYPSLSKARVVCDKKSTKSRSYGFVSFSDTDDYFRAAKEMQGKYIGSHPVLIKRATSEVKAVVKREDKNKHNKNNKNKNQVNKAGTNTVPAVTPTSAMFVPRGVQKKGKNSGPRLLG